MADLTKTLKYILPAATPAAASYFMGGGLDLSLAGIGGAGALVGVFAGNAVGAVGGFLKIESQTTSNLISGLAAGAGCGAALVFLGGKNLAAVAPLAGMTAVVAIAAGFISDSMAKKSA